MINIIRILVTLFNLYIIMKKAIYLIPVLGTLIACSGKAEQKENVSTELKEETELIEKTIQEIDESIQNSEIEIEKTQSEIDSLLNDI